MSGALGIDGYNRMIFNRRQLHQRQEKRREMRMRFVTELEKNHYSPMEDTIPAEVRAKIKAEIRAQMRNEARQSALLWSGIGLICLVFVAWVVVQVMF